MSHSPAVWESVEYATVMPAVWESPLLTGYMADISRLSRGGGDDDPGMMDGQDDGVTTFSALMAPVSSVMYYLLPPPGGILEAALNRRHPCKSRSLIPHSGLGDYLSPIHSSPYLHHFQTTFRQEMLVCPIISKGEGILNDLRLAAHANYRLFVFELLVLLL